MENNIEKIIDVNSFTDEQGYLYKKITKEILVPRKTYVKGTITGKYRGAEIVMENPLHNTSFYEFEIYEAEVICNGINDFRKNRPFIYPEDFDRIGKEEVYEVFPKEKLPHLLPVLLKSESNSFAINILEPQLFEFTIDRKMHQTYDDEVFGSFQALITGYVFDYEKHIEEEVVGPIYDTEEDKYEEEDNADEELIFCEKSEILTGRSEKKGNYFRQEFYCKNHNDKIWDDWQYIHQQKESSSVGCASYFLGFLTFLIGGAFILAFLPNLFYILIFFIVGAIIYYAKTIFQWLLRIVAILFFAFFIISLITKFISIPIPSSNTHNSTRNSSTTHPKENVVEEIKTIDNNNAITSIRDTVYKRYRNWKDYEGNTYEGYYTYNKRSYLKAKKYKKDLNVIYNTPSSYDYMVFSLKENDKNELAGVYKLFDSIQAKNDLNRLEFAEMVVSFVQDMPYAIILDGPCDKTFYKDKFIFDYLSNPNSICEGYQRFGINTPVEFLATIKGDCDTRTLFLYTVLSHYSYDVVLLSSEIYKHSIFGINLPYVGKSYLYDNKNYILWETTHPNFTPGIINDRISNQKNWRISLKST